MKKKLTFLGIETSCDETAASIVREKSDGTGEILSNIVSSQVEEHKEFGGIVPEVAARAHIEKIEFIIKKAIKESNLTFNDIDNQDLKIAPLGSVNYLKKEIFDENANSKRALGTLPALIKANKLVYTPFSKLVYGLDVKLLVKEKDLYKYF